MNSIQLYSNEKFSVRTTRDMDGTVWFVAKDIAEALEYSEESIKSLANLLAPVPEHWKGRKRIQTIERGFQEMVCLTEQGVYFFLGRSDKPKALPYQMWIAGEVMPSIMHTGSYSIGEYKPSISKQEIEGLAFFYEYAGLKGNQATLALDKYIRACTGRSALEVGEVALEAPKQNQPLTPTEIGRQLGISARTVNSLLAEAGYQHKIAGRWEALEPGLPYSVLLDTGKAHSDGVPVCQLKWYSDILPVIERLMEDCA